MPENLWQDKHEFFPILRNRKYHLKTYKISKLTWMVTFFELSCEKKKNTTHILTRKDWERKSSTIFKKFSHKVNGINLTMVFVHNKPFYSANQSLLLITYTWKRHWITLMFEVTRLFGFDVFWCNASLKKWKFKNHISE